MKQRRVITVCGRYRSILTYTPITIDDVLHKSPYTRAAKQKITTEARRKINYANKTKQLERILYGNFSGRDYYVTLTYDTEHTPNSRKEARKNVRKFLKSLRRVRAASGDILKYIYTTEGKHGAGLLHHHVFINATARNDLRDFIYLWGYAAENGVDIRPIEDGDNDIHTRATYSTKEIKDNGEQSYTCSRNLIRPETAYSWKDGSAQEETPAGAVELSREIKETAYGAFYYLEYLLPEIGSSPAAACRRYARST